MTGPAGAARQPWNTAFEWTDHPGLLWALTNAQAEQFGRDGFLAFGDVVAPGTAAIHRTGGFWVLSSGP